MQECIFRKQSLKYDLKQEINDFQWTKNENDGEGSPHGILKNTNIGNNTLKFKRNTYGLRRLIKLCP